MTDQYTINGYLEDLKFKRSEDGFGGGLFQLEFLLGNEEETNKLRILGVKEISEMSLTANEPVFIQVTDISARGWDKFKFEVSEISDNRFCIYCSEVELERSN